MADAVIGPFLPALARSSAPQWILGTGLGAVIVASLWLGGGTGLWDTLFYVFLWGAAATAWSLQAGTAGRLSLGHQAYFGIGAYTAALLQLNSITSIWLTVAIALVVTAVAGGALEIVTGRLSGIYYALATFAFAQLLYLIARSWTDVTRGTAGISSPNFDPDPANLRFDSQFDFAVAAAVLCAGAIACYVLLGRGRIGYFVRALRDSEPAAVAIGISRVRWRTIIAAISAALTSLAGVLFFQYLSYVDPDSGLAFHVFIFVLLPAIIGGIHHPLGPLAGALLIIPVRQALLATSTSTSASAIQGIVYGVVLLVVTLFAAEGLIRRLLDLSRPRPTEGAVQR